MLELQARQSSETRSSRARAVVFAQKEGVFPLLCPTRRSPTRLSVGPGLGGRLPGKHPAWFCLAPCFGSREFPVTEPDVGTGGCGESWKRDFGFGNLETSEVEAVKIRAGFTAAVSHFEEFGASSEDSVPVFLAERIFFFFLFYKWKFLRKHLELRLFLWRAESV